MLERFFKLKENGTDIKTEVIGGVTTFMAMAYILAVNPSILSTTGMDSQAVLIATALASFVGTLCMALLANYPFALAPSLGLNAYFTYTVCGSMGYPWQLALLAVFVEGIIFLLLSLTSVREAIFDAIPLQLKKGVSVGIGLYVAFIGFQNGFIVVNSDATLVTSVNFRNDFSNVGICALLALIGLLIISVLYVKNVKGFILIGIIATWILGIIAQLTDLYTGPSVLPVWSDFNITAVSQTFGQCFNSAAFNKFNILDFFVIICAFLFVDVFDTLGTLIGCANKAKMLDKDGKLPRIKSALLADSIATSVGAVFGTSTTTTFVESSSGVSEGARTGLASVVTALLFLISIILSPIFIAIPKFATAPALIFVGFLMIMAIKDISFDDPMEAIPAYLALITMPLLYSTSDGIAVGVISYVIIHVFGGKAKEVKPLMYILSILFVMKYVFL